MDFLVSQTLKRAGPRTGTEIAPADRPFLNQSLFSWGYVGAQERRSLQPTGPLQKHFVARANSNRLVVVVIHIPTAVWSGKYCYPATAFPSSSIVGTDFGTGDIYLLLLGLANTDILPPPFCLRLSSAPVPVPASRPISISTSTSRSLLGLFSLTGWCCPCGDGSSGGSACSASSSCPGSPWCGRSCGKAAAHVTIVFFAVGTKKAHNNKKIGAREKTAVWSASGRRKSGPRGIRP